MTNPDRFILLILLVIDLIIWGMAVVRAVRYNGIPL